MNKKETMKQVKVRIKKAGEAQRKRMRKGYSLARDLGVSSYESQKICSWSECRIREYAKET